MTVEFEEYKAYSPSQGVAPISGLTALLVKKGLAKDASSASRIMLGVAITAAVLAILIYGISARTPKTHPIERPTPPLNDSRSI